jgi:hypothetical protein
MKKLRSCLTGNEKQALFIRFLDTMIKQIMDFLFELFKQVTEFYCRFKNLQIGGMVE